MKTILSWSSGKDSAWALRALKADPDIELLALATTFNQTHDRVAMHAVRRELVREQAKAAGLPLWEVEIPHGATNEQYEEAMQGLIDRAKEAQAQAFAFGDLFLEDIRDYRLKMMEPTGLQCLFPLWGQDTLKLSREMRDGGLKAWITCVDPRKLDRGLAGKAWDKDFDPTAHPGVDPCAENGEFHTFAWSGPMFDRDIACQGGEVVEREGFVFADLVKR